MMQSPFAAAGAALWAGSQARQIERRSIETHWI
jgi:hypothetical protein